MYIAFKEKEETEANNYVSIFNFLCNPKIYNFEKFEITGL